MDREHCLTQLTDVLAAYLRAIVDETGITPDEAREVAAECSRHILYSLELEEETQ